MVLDKEQCQMVEHYTLQNKHTSIFSSFLVTSRSPAIVCSMCFFSNAPVYRTPSKQPTETQSTNTSAYSIWTSQTKKKRCRTWEISLHPAFCLLGHDCGSRCNNDQTEAQLSQSHDSLDSSVDKIAVFEIRTLVEFFHFLHGLCNEYAFSLS